MFSFLAGFTAGVVLGVLLAPECGTAARSYVRRHTEEIRESALDAFDRGRHFVNRRMERLAGVPTPAADVYQR